MTVDLFPCTGVSISSDSPFEILFRRWMMHKSLATLIGTSVLGILSLTTACQATDVESVASRAVIPSGYKLVWADEFSGAGLPESKKWGYDTRGNSQLWWHNERQYYTRDRMENARIENGHLVIEVRKEELKDGDGWAGQEFTSARLRTYQKASWKYGFFDVRAKLACGVGAWPAIWLLSDTGKWPQDGEIDIMEQVGHEPGMIYSTLHSSTKEYMGGKLKIADTCGAYHNYQLDWRENQMTFYVDGEQVYHVEKGDRGYESWPFNQKFYLLLNVTVGGAWGAQKGIDPMAFPTEMDVDYVRVYQQN